MFVFIFYLSSACPLSTLSSETCFRNGALCSLAKLKDKVIHQVDQFVLGCRFGDRWDYLETVLAENNLVHKMIRESITINTVSYPPSSRLCCSLWIEILHGWSRVNRGIIVNCILFTELTRDDFANRPSRPLTKRLTHESASDWINWLYHHVTPWSCLQTRSTFSGILWRLFRVSKGYFFEDLRRRIFIKLERASQKTHKGSEPSNHKMSTTVNPKAFPLANAQLCQQILDLVQQGYSQRPLY